MKTFSVASFNLRNHYWDKHWDGENFPQILGDFIETEKIDFLGVQELVRLYALNLQSKLGRDYHLYGNYRFGNLPFVSQINEANAIITKEKVLKSETNYLACIPLLSHGTAFPRIFTTIETADLMIINTHIEYWQKTPQKNQLRVLYNYIWQNQKKNPIIMGDFNMDQSLPYFVDFIKALENINIYLLPNNVSTFANEIKDYIFLPGCYQIDDFQVYKEGAISTISDHSPILARIKKS